MILEAWGLLAPAGEEPYTPSVISTPENMLAMFHQGSARNSGNSMKKWVENHPGGSWTLNIDDKIFGIESRLAHGNGPDPWILFESKDGFIWYITRSLSLMSPDYELSHKDISSVCYSSVDEAKETFEKYWKTRTFSSTL